MPLQGGNLTISPSTLPWATVFFGFQPEEKSSMRSLGLDVLRSRNNEHDLAFHRMCLVVCKQFGSVAATEFLKFFC